MSPEEFLERIKEIDVTFWYRCDGGEGSRSWQRYAYDEIRKRNEGITLDDFVKVEWSQGGVSGGSCWDTGEGPDPHHPFSGESEPEFDCLDKILTELVPEISFMKYKAIASACVKYDERCEHEYYGNYTDYGIKKVVLRDLYEKMKDLSLI